MKKRKKATAFGEALIEGLEELAAWKRGEIELEVVEYERTADGVVQTKVEMSRWPVK